MKDDRPATYHAHAQATADDERGGRFSGVTTTTIVGAGPMTVPKQPSESPWHCDPAGTEPPLGYDINTQEPVGELHEREAARPAVVGLRRRI